MTDEQNVAMDRLGELLMPQAPSVEVVKRERVVPNPGIYFGLDEAIYHSWEAVSNSLLSRFAITPAHTKVEKPRSKALDSGKLLHTAVLEPDIFMTFRTAGQCEAVTGKGARCVNDALALYAGEPLCGVHGKNRTADVATIIPATEYRNVLLARDSIFRHPAARKALSGDHCEVSLVWNDEETGLLCKARIDHVNEAEDCIVDLKSAQSASAFRFPKDAYKFGYLRQGAFYGDAALRFPDFMLIDPTHKLVAVELDNPFMVNVFPTPSHIIDAMRVQYRSLLRRYAECLEKDEWPAEGPGYSQGEIDMELSGYAAAEIESLMIEEVMRA